MQSLGTRAAPRSPITWICWLSNFVLSTIMLISSRKTDARCIMLCSSCANSCLSARLTL